MLGDLCASLTDCSFESAACLTAIKKTPKVANLSHWFFLNFDSVSAELPTVYELSAQDLADLVTADAKHQRHALKKLGGIAGVAAKLKVTIGCQLSFAFDSYIVSKVALEDGISQQELEFGATARTEAYVKPIYIYKYLQE